jgi:uncharacterized membrane protein YGL010W
MKTKLEEMLDNYKADHQHPVNKATHMVGIPLILASLPLMFLLPPLGISLFIFGWILQFIGHAFEGKPPSFFRDPKFLFVGATWYIKRALGMLEGDQPSSAG